MPSRSREALILEEAAALAPGRVLDIAYAHGPNRLLEAVGATVDGIDPLVRAAPFKSMTRCDINAEPIPFPDATFDVVTMGCVLAHTARPLRVLSEIHRVLAPGGTLILTSPNPNYYWESVTNLWYRHFAPRVAKSKHLEHFFEFTRYAMRTILDRAGFALTKEVGAGFTLVKSGMRFSVEKHPGLAYEIIYVAKKTGEPKNYTIVENEEGKTVEFATDLFS